VSVEALVLLALFIVLPLVQQLIQAVVCLRQTLADQSHAR
jgi:hypothetical protein